MLEGNSSLQHLTLVLKRTDIPEGGRKNEKRKDVETDGEKRERDREREPGYSAAINKTHTIIHPNTH